MPSPVDQRKPLLAGNLSEFSLESLMSAFSLGRQLVAIEVLSAGGVCDGRVVMKGGRVLSASAAGRTGIEAVQHLVASAAPAKFRVVREASEVYARAPHLGTLPEVTGASGGAGTPAARVSDSTRVRTRVIEGSLADFDVATIVQVVSTARQHTVMEVLTHRGTRAGSIHLKAGKVLRAQAGSLHGIAAVRELLRAPSSFRFTVHRSLESIDDLPLLGAVPEVLMRAASEARPVPRSGVHLAPAPASVAHARDPDEIETLIPPPRAPAPPVRVEIDGASDEIEYEVTRARAQRIPTRPTRPADGEPVLNGRLSDFDLCSVLQVAGLSRQPTSVRVFDDQRLPVGEVRVQGGQVLAASAQGQRDRMALRLLLHSPCDFHFSVWRQPGQPNVAMTPLGTISEVLQQVTAPPPSLTANADATPAFHPQAASLPPGAPTARTRKRAVGVGILLLAAAAAGIATSDLLREGSSVEPTVFVLKARGHAPGATGQATDDVSPPMQAPRAPAPDNLIAPQVEPLVSIRPLSTPMAARSRAEIASIQGALRMLGFGPGPIDGVAGPFTRAAIAAFQRAEGLPSDGELSPSTEQRLHARIRSGSAADPSGI